MHQALRAAKMATSDESAVKEILDRTGAMIKTIPMQATPAETGMMVYRIVKEVTGVDDPYKAIKRKHIAEAKSIYPELEELVEKSNDQLLTAIRIAIAGNVIDLGINKTFDIVSDVKKIMYQEFEYSTTKHLNKHWIKRKTSFIWAIMPANRFLIRYSSKL